MAKNSDDRTDGKFKPVVRVFKNMRSYLVDNNLLEGSKAPSYFLQNLIYNAPDYKFFGNCQMAVGDILDYLWDNFSHDFTCQNEHHSLFGNTSEQWNVEDAITTLAAMRKLWANW